MEKGNTLSPLAMVQCDQQSSYSTRIFYSGWAFGHLFMDVGSQAKNGWGRFILQGALDRAGASVPSMRSLELPSLYLSVPIFQVS